MQYEIFKGDKDKKTAIAALNELLKHPGWDFIDRALTLNIDHFTEKLRELLRSRDDTGESFRMQDQIDTLESLRNLPAILIAEAAEDSDAEEPDVYDTPEPPKESES